MADALPGSTTESADGLLAKLRAILAGYSIGRFAVYTLDGDEADLAFQSGVVPPAGPLGSNKVSWRRHGVLRDLLGGLAPCAIRADPTLGADDVEFMREAGAVALFRMRSDDQQLGFIAVFGDVPPDMFLAPVLDELLTYIAFFSSSFAQRRAVDRMRRDFMHTRSKQRDLHASLDILLLHDRDEILGTVLERCLALCGAKNGMFWSHGQAGWTLDYAVGVPTTECMAELEKMLNRSREMNRPGLVSSLSGEEHWDFDVDAIHMALIAVFPVRVRASCVGCVVAFDCTVQLDVIDSVEQTALVGAAALESWENAHRLLEQQRIREQLAVAAEAQMRLLPARQPNIPGISVAHYSRYCDETGGDYVDAILGAEPHLSGLAVGDVSGHGVGAALLMVDLRARLRTYLETCSSWTPSEVLSRLNRVLYPESAPEEFVTLVLCLFDSRTGALRYASAGHEPPLVYRASSQTWEALPSTGLPLAMEEGATYSEACVFLDPADVVVFATDGAAEARSRAAEPLGTDTLRAVAQSLARNSAQGILDGLVRRTLRHCHGVPFDDDITFLVIKVEELVLRVQENAPVIPHAPTYTATFSATRAAKDRELSAVKELLAASYGEGDDVAGVVIAVEEALSNAVLHGNLEDGERELRLKVFCDPERAAIIIAHDGEPFDPRSTIPAYIDVDALNKEHGRGILIMTSLLDEVTYWDQGRAALLVKHLNGQSDG